MIDWRFCGRFSDMSQDAFPPPNGWIDEAEAVVATTTRSAN